MSKIFYSLKLIQTVIKDNKPSKVCLVTSEKLVKKLAWAIKEINIPKAQIVLIPDGESAKTWKELEILLKKFSQLNLDRESIIVALGGGTVGDLTGFATSIYLRGVKYIQIPTTLLAQVDSAHGGKTGIDFLNYKNQIGSFYLPVATIIDTKFLKFLPEEQVINGLGEIIKYGFIQDLTILSILRKYTVSSIIDSADLIKIIKKSIAVKNYFTSKDFEDNNLRSILNVGHTFGHAIELKYKIGHGEAVIIGMLQELMFTESQGFTSSSVKKNLEWLLNQLEVKVDTKMKADWNMMIHDKKVAGKVINFPVIEREGKVRLIKLNLDTLKSMVK